MRSATRLLLAVIQITLIWTALCGSSMADSDKAKDFAVRLDRYYVSYQINLDGSYTETRESAVTVLKESALDDVKHESVSYSTSIQKAEVISAYTQKADGRRIDVPPSNYQVKTNTGKDKNSPVFSDHTTLSVVFPDLEVGDSAVFVYKLIASEPMFPGHFSTFGYYAKTLPYQDVRVKIDAPAALWTQHWIQGMQEIAHQEKDGRKVLEWHYSNKQPVESKRRDYSVFVLESEPGYQFSTFRQHADIAQAYGARATPKAVVNARIQKLADEIIKEKKNARETARLLYEWVAKNITFAGNCIGIGAVVPHDTDFILDNKMGDCKDHATLLQALLAAKGINSTQALINVGSSYQLPKIPLVSMVNHVINYIPELNVYADATSEQTPFGRMPTHLVGKPVLHIDEKQESRKTPLPALAEDKQYMHSIIHIQPDGSIKVKVNVKLKGELAVNARAQMRKVEKKHEDEYFTNLYKRNGLIASGKLEKDDPTELTDSYQYGAQFEVKNYYTVGAGAFTIRPYLFSQTSIDSIVYSSLEAEEENVATTCHGGYVSDEYTFIFPKNWKLLSVPKNFKTANQFASYEASYKHKGNTLTVRRILDDKTPGIICQADYDEVYQQFAKKIMPDISAQVLYK